MYNCHKCGRNLLNGLKSLSKETFSIRTEIKAALRGKLKPTVVTQLALALVTMRSHDKFTSRLKSAHSNNLK